MPSSPAALITRAKAARSPAATAHTSTNTLHTRTPSRPRAASRRQATGSEAPVPARMLFIGRRFLPGWGCLVLHPALRSTLRMGWASYTPPVGRPGSERPVSSDKDGQKRDTTKNVLKPVLWESRVSKPHASGSEHLYVIRQLFGPPAKRVAEVDHLGGLVELAFDLHGVVVRDDDHAVGLLNLLVAQLHRG